MTNEFDTPPTAGTILLTGGAGDLAVVLTPMLLGRGHQVRRMDVRLPRDNSGGNVIIGSILDREALELAVQGCNAIVHIAGWHGIHEGEGRHSGADFWDLNMTGTFNVLDAAVRLGVNDIVFISSTSVRRRKSFYGHTKVLGEQLVAWFADPIREGTLNALCLRPRAFVPHWNRDVYNNVADWAKWFWRGAVSIDDVARAVILSLLAMRRRRFAGETMVLDSRDDFTTHDRTNWDSEGPGSTFRRVYPEFVDSALQHGLDISRPPERLDYSRAQELIGFTPLFGMREMLQGLQKLQENT